MSNQPDAVNHYALTLAAPSRTGRAFALVLALHAGAFFVLHIALQTKLPAQLAETISAQIVTEYKLPELIKPVLPLPTSPKSPPQQLPTQVFAPAQPAPVLPPQATAPLAQAPSAAPAITVAPAPATPTPTPMPMPMPQTVPVPAAPTKPSVVIAPSRVESSCAAPRYPAASERLREEGVVTLRFLISENGQVISGQVDKSSGYKRLDDAALAALSLCKFKPATVDGKPRQDWSALRYRWELKDD